MPILAVDHSQVLGVADQRVLGNVSGAESYARELTSAELSTLIGLGSYLTVAAAAAAYQPVDGDLTALAGLTGTNTIYYRSGANTWTAVTIGSGLSFSGGTLATSGVLLAANNLSDLTDLNAAYTNLGLGTGAFANIGSYVPYTGATTNVNLGSNSLTAGAGTFSGTATVNALNISTTNPTGGSAVANGLEMQMATQMYLKQGGNTVFKFFDGVPRVNLGKLTIGGSGVETHLYGTLNRLQQRSNTNPQQFDLFSTYTSSTVQEYLKFRAVAGANFEIGPANGSAGGTLRGLTLGGYTNDSSAITPWLTFTNTGAATFSGSQAFNTSYHFVNWSGACVGWSSAGTVNSTSSLDTAFKRVSAGLVEINNGTAGTYRDLVLRNLRMSSPTVPASASDTGSEGQISWDSDYVYVCTATNTWKRAALSTF